MKFLHLADLHIGKVVSGFSMMEDQRHILQQAVDIALQRKAQALVLAGDLYDKTTPSAEAVSLLDWFLTLATSQGLSVFAIPGNHDSAERVSYASSLLERQGVFLPPAFNGTVAHHIVHDEHGPITFWLLPFLKPAHVRPYFPDAEIEQSYTAATKAVLDSCALDAAQRNVLVAHQFVTAGSQTPELSDSEVNVGGLDNVDASVFDAFDYVALGHIHRPQRIGRDEVRYAGSPLKYSFSETTHIKSACLVDLGEKGSVSVELVSLTPLHDMREIRGPLDSLTSADVASQANPLDYLHVVLTDEVAALDAMARVRAVYPNVMAISYDNAKARHKGQPMSSSADVQSMDSLSLFKSFFAEQNGYELTDAQEDIVQNALAKAGCNEKGGTA